MGGYHQWSLPIEIDPHNKKDYNLKQCQRFSLMLQNWEKASLEKKDIIILDDSNKIQNIYDMFNEQLEKLNFIAKEIKSDKKYILKVNFSQI